MEKVFFPQIRRSLLITGLISVLFPVLFLSPVSAAGPQLRLTPTYSEITLDAAHPEAAFDIEVTNTGNSYETFLVSVVDFGTMDQTGGLAFLGTSATEYGLKYGLASWIIADKNYLQAPPGGSDRIKITVVNKDSLSPGGHYAAILLGSDATADSGRGNVSFNYAFSSLVFVKKLGGEITKLELTPPAVGLSWLALPQKINLHFQNSGNIHLVPRGEISLIDPAGRQVGRGIINTDSAIILPESFRDYAVRPQPVGFAYIPGRYTLKVNYRFDGNDSFTAVSSSFWFIGLPAILVLSVLVMAVILLLAVIRRRHLIHAQK